MPQANDGEVSVMPKCGVCGLDNQSLCKCRKAAWGMLDKSLHPGQVAWNVAYMILGERLDILKESNLDPFYDDTRIRLGSSPRRTKRKSWHGVVGRAGPQRLYGRYRACASTALTMMTMMT